MPRIPKRGLPGRRPVKPRLNLRVTKGIEKLKELPEGALSLPEQEVLRRIEDILTGVKGGQLKETDLNNMKRIARKHRVKL